MTLPAHRYEQRKKKDKAHVWCFDFDGTITGAPKRLARIAQGLKKMGDTIVVLTGNASPRDELEQILRDFDFPFDELVQYHDDDSNGIARAEHLKQFGAWGAFDNRIDRAVIFAKVCPHLYLIAEPTKEDVDDAHADDAKKAAKKAAKSIGLRSNRPERRGPPRIPTGYDPEGGTPESHCGNCDMFWQGMCWGFGDVRVDPVHGKCKEWTPDEQDQETP